MPFGIIASNKRTRRLALEREAAKAAAAASRKERAYIEQRVNVPVAKLTDYASYLKACSSTVWALARACTIYSNRILSTDFEVVRGKDRAPVPEADPLAKLIAEPNPHDSFEDMLAMWAPHMIGTGNSFWYRDQMNSRGQPLELYPLLPQHIKIVPSRTEKVDHYKYAVTGDELRFERDELIHFKRPHPTSLLWGLGVVEGAESLHGGFINRNAYEEKFFEAGASPSGVLTLEDYEADPDEWAKLKAWWKADYEGKKNIGKTAMMNGKWVYQQLGLSQKEMESIESEKMDIENIFTNAGIPLSVAGLREAANYATADREEVNFRVYEIKPMLDLLTGKLNAAKGLARAYSPGHAVSYELAGMLDLRRVNEEFKPAVECGAMTRNEFREALGLGRVDDPLMDQFLVNRNLVPIEFAGLADPFVGDQPEPG